MNANPELVRLSQEYCDYYRNDETIEDINGDWEVVERWVERTGPFIKIRRGSQERSMPENYVVLKSS